MSRKPSIGIMAIIEQPMESAFTFDRIYTNGAYVSMVEKSGGVAVIIPTWDRRYLDLCDGFLFQGGQDIDPSLYGQEASPLCDLFRSDMDRRDIAAVHDIVDARKPILGICRGHQIINVALGGTLFQDQSLVTELRHDRLDNPYTAVHNVILSSSIKDLFGNNNIGVNSLHHQIVDKVAPGLHAAAVCAEDSTIEALEGDRILTVQWHPEAMGDVTLFRHLVQSI